MENVNGNRNGSGKLRSALVFCRPLREDLEVVVREAAAGWAGWLQLFKRQRYSLAEFLRWLMQSGLVVARDVHRREVERLRAEAQGDRRLLCRARLEGGLCKLTFSLGSGSHIVGSGEVDWAALPDYARRGDHMLVTLAAPRCRGCGCTNERACQGGCSWVEPDLCSRCFEKSTMMRREGGACQTPKAQKCGVG